MKNKTNFMTKTWVIVVGAMICCTLWGSAFPCIKIGYRMMEIAAADTASQILYAGYRFTLAGTNDCFGKHPATENIAAKAEFHRKNRAFESSADGASIFIFLYRIGAHDRCKSLNHRSGQYICGNSCRRLSFPPGNRDFAQNARLPDWICGRGAC